VSENVTPMYLFRHLFFKNKARKKYRGSLWNGGGVKRKLSDNIQLVRSKKEPLYRKRKALYMR